MKSLTEALATCSESDLRRLALCYLTVVDKNNSVDWAAAAAAYDPKVQVSSFKTVTSRVVKKLDLVPGNYNAETPAKGKGKANKAAKRKAPSDAEDDEGEEAEEGGKGDAPTDAKKAKKDVKAKANGNGKAKGKAKKGGEDGESDEDTIRVKSEKGGAEPEDEGDVGSFF